MNLKARSGTVHASSNEEGLTACGRDAVRMDQTEEEVTCKNCIANNEEPAPTSEPPVDETSVQEPEPDRVTAEDLIPKTKEGIPVRGAGRYQT